MVNPELTKYIDSMKSSGFSDEETRKKLLDAGWATNEVNAALGTGPAPAAAPAAKAAASPGMAYQGIGIRLAAQVIDGIIFFVIYWIVGGFFASIYGGVVSGGFELQGAPALLVMAILFIINIGYFTVLEGSKGQTVGKMVCGIKVVKEDGSPCGMHAALIRNILRIVDGIMVYLVGAILITNSDRKQRLGDRVAKTVVVKK